MTIDECRMAVLAAVQSEVRLSPDALRLWSVCAECAQEGRTARRVAPALGLQKTTLLSGSARRGLPSPKRILAYIRLCYAAVLFDRESTAGGVASALGCGGLRSWNRHLQRYHGLTPSRVRDEVPFPMAREILLDQLVRPFAEEWSRYSFFGDKPHSLAARERMAA